MDAQEIRIPIGDIELAGSLAMPTRSTVLVMFAHRSGSSRHSPRNRHVAAQLDQLGLATLLFDLLTADEERIDAIDTMLRFDTDLLSERLIAAIVSRGGRPDLASGSLALVRAPTLLIVGGADDWVLQANREAAAQMTAAHEVAVVPGATHLFEEPGALDEVARLAGSWFVDHFAHFAAAHVKEAS